VATVLQSPFPGQKRRYGVLITFKTDEECRADLEDLLAQAVRNGPILEEYEDEETKHEFVVHGHEAEDTLTSLFRTKPGFRNLDETRRTLNGTRKSFEGEPGSNAISKDALLERMLRWLAERREDAHVDADYRLYVETDYEVGNCDMDDGMTGLNTLLRKYTTGNVEKGEETFWPVVQDVRYVGFQV